MLHLFIMIMLLIGFSPDADNRNISHPTPSGDDSPSVAAEPLAKGAFGSRMKEIPLSYSTQKAIVDDESFDYSSQFGWFVVAKRYAGRCIRVNGNWTVLLMHRDLLGLKPGEFGDHINGNGFDNRRSNIRRCTHKQNCRNSKISATNTTGYKGVSFDKRRKKFYAYIRAENVRKFLGYYNAPAAAAMAYNSAASVYYGEFARLNTIPA